MFFMRKLFGSGLFADHFMENKKKYFDKTIFFLQLLRNTLCVSELKFDFIIQLKTKSKLYKFLHNLKFTTLILHVKIFEENYLKKKINK